MIAQNPTGPETRWRRLLAAASAALAAALALTLLAARGTGEPAAEVRRQFREAGQALAGGRGDEAVRLYEEIERRGQATAEVHYNLGNARALEGRVGEAILAYRRAWRLAPRDPDVDANLRLALEAAGAAEPDLTGFEIAFTGASAPEWGATALAAWWSLWTLGALATALRRWRRPLGRAAAVAGAVFAAALLGLLAWEGLERAPELVVLGDTRNALRAPDAAAPPHFTLPEGSLVRARGRQGEWVRVTHGQLEGWVRRDALAPVLPQAPPPE